MYHVATLDDPHMYIEKEAAGSRLTMSHTFLLVADRDVFATDRLRLMYLDGKRNIVQEMRTPFDGQSPAAALIDFSEFIIPSELWENGTPGVKYGLYGEIGMNLYRLDDEHLDMDF